MSFTRPMKPQSVERWCNLIFPHRDTVTTICFHRHTCSYYGRDDLCFAILNCEVVASEQKMSNDRAELRHGRLKAVLRSPPHIIQVPIIHSSKNFWRENQSVRLAFVGVGGSFLVDRVDSVVIFFVFGDFENSLEECKQ